MEISSEGKNFVVPETTLLPAFMDSLKDPFLFVDSNHTIRFMNKAALLYYSLGEKLIGRSILDCHNENSRCVILDIFEKMKEGLEEQLITDNERHRIYMRAVRDAGGALLGYFERFEPPRKFPGRK